MSHGLLCLCSSGNNSGFADDAGAVVLSPSCATDTVSGEMSCVVGGGAVGGRALLALVCGSRRVPFVVSFVPCEGGACDCGSFTPAASKQLSGGCGKAAVGSTCTLACRPGLALLSGSLTRSCDSVGVWGTDFGSCGCGVLTPGAEQYLSGGCGAAAVGSSCSLSCSSGFALLSGSLSPVCGGGGWEGVATCGCPAVSPAASSYMSGSCGVTAVGSGCTLSCNAGMELSQGSLTRSCGAGGWGADFGSCGCAAYTPEAGRHLSGSCSTTSVGSTCSLSCGAGLVLLSGTLNPVCVSEGFVNVAVCGCDVHVPSVTKYVSGNCTAAQVGSTCTLPCNPGLVVSTGTLTQTCSSNGWSEFGVCGCPAFTPEAGRLMTGSCAAGSLVGSACTLECNSGLSLTAGSLTPTCGVNGWVGLGSCGSALASTQRAALVDLFSLIPGWSDPGTHACSWTGVTCGSGDSTVVTVQLPSSGLVGALPASLASLVDLEVLELWANSLNGGLPGSLGSLTRLRVLSMCCNDLVGAVPTELGSLLNLEQLQLHFNSLTSLPTEVGLLTKLTHLALGKNSFEGTLPSSLGGLTRLRTLTLRANKFSGSIPSEFGNLVLLETLYAFAVAAAAYVLLWGVFGC